MKIGESYVVWEFASCLHRNQVVEIVEELPARVGPGASGPEKEFLVRAEDGVEFLLWEHELEDDDVDDEKEVIFTADGGGELREGERRVVISGTTVVERDAEEDD